MYCPNCGTQNKDDAKFCSGCGCTLQQSASQYQQPTQAQQIPQPPQYQQSQYQPYQQPQPLYQPFEQAQPALPMKWHKFLIYFSLWASGILNIASGIQTLTGSQYGGYADSVYSVFSAMKGLDIIFGLLIIATGAFAIYTRFRLAKFKKDGPKMLMYLYIAVLVASLLYAGIASIIIEESCFDSSVIINLGMSAVMLFVNRTYYQKRAHLFVNN